MKIARRLTSLALAMLLSCSVFAGCIQEDTAEAPEVAATAAVEAVVEEVAVVEEAPVVEEVEEVAVAEEVKEEIASTGSAESDAKLEVRLYMIDTSGWNTFESKESAVITTDGGTYTLSITAPEMSFNNIASIYIKDYFNRIGNTSKSIFSSATITLDKVTFNGTELTLAGNVAEEAVGSNGLFDYSFVNQWYTPALRISSMEIPEGKSSYVVSGAEYVDGLNTLEVTFTVAPISSANILTEEETRRELTGIKVNSTGIALTAGESASLTCDPAPIVCRNYIYGFDSKVVWTSSDPAVATVQNGVVTAVADGTATITASYDGYTSSCIVSVLPDVPVSLVSLYMQSTSSWANYASDPVAISETGEYSFSITGNANDFKTMGSLYLKDIEAYALGDNTGDYSTAYPNAVVDIISVTLNGVEMLLNAKATDYNAGALFDVQVVNGWWMDGTTVENAGCDIIDYWRPEAYFTNEDGSVSSAYVEGDNVIEVTIDVTDLDSTN